MMKCKLFLISILYMTIFISSPKLTEASSVPWTSETYSVAAQAGPSVDSETGPVPSLEALASPVGGGSARATITDTSMYAHASETSAQFWAKGQAQFKGTYMSEAVNPVFRFTYSLIYDDHGYPYTYPVTANDWENDDFIYASAWLKVTDDTDNIDLYSNNILALSSTPTNIFIDTIPDHMISVDFGVSAFHFTVNTGRHDLTLTYETAVAPEPVSSVLFVTGGTLLAGRRLLKRRRP